MRWFNRSRDHDPLRSFFLTRLQRLIVLCATPSAETQTVLLVERAFVSTLVDCIRLGATGDAIGLLRDTWGHTKAQATSRSGDRGREPADGSGRAQCA
jgi:hypothetical protein